VNPSEAARALREEIIWTLTDLSGGAPAVTVLAVLPPDNLGADTSFRVRLRAADGRRVEADLPSGLVMGYLADEEAAVDEWKTVVGGIWERCC
jgi:hypothetical protein